MGRGYLNNACTEFHINIVIGNNGDLSSYQREDKCLADNILVTVIVGVYCNCGIAQQSFGTGGSKLNISAAVLERISQVPEMAGLILVGNFRI